MSTQEMPPILAGIDLEEWMREALAEAEAAGLAGEMPIGAVLVVEWKIASRGHVHRERARSQLAHAEIRALLTGGELLWAHYRDSVLFTTVEPCPMCLGAAVMADVPHIVFAAHDAAAGSGRIVETVPYVRRHIKAYIGGVLEAESHAVLERFDPGLLQYIRTGCSRVDPADPLPNRAAPTASSS